MRPRRRFVLPAIVVLAIGLTACNPDEPGPDDSPTPTASDTPTDATPTASEALPGEPFMEPEPGAELAVIGVEAGGTLELTSLPGGGELVGALTGTATAVVATGRGRLVDAGLFFEVEADVTGWGDATYLAYLGTVDDITSAVSADLGSLPSAETMLQMADEVAATRASTEPASKITVVVAPSVGDLGEITVDVVGLGDDAQAGERLHIFATPDAGGESFTLKTVEMTVLCSRGVTAEGACV